MAEKGTKCPCSTCVHPPNEIKKELKMKGQALETGLRVRKQQHRRVPKTEPEAHTHDNHSQQSYPSANDANQLRHMVLDHVDRPLAL
ncbi:hypothetical protein RUM43_006570 [Polyplax serrata]|uniref:Uncharacterized protein n=1 Tax=Polyplax serrata TaxID=468196 RepID=A0AAN8P1I2_POLSC